MSASGLVEAVEAEGFGGGGVVAPAFGDVQVAVVFEGRDDGGADGSQVGGPLPLCETAGTRARRLPLTPGSRRPACCGVRSEPDPPALARARCAEPGDGLDGAQARLWGACP